MAFGDEDNHSTTGSCNTSRGKAKGRRLANRCVGQIQKLEVGSRSEGEVVTVRKGGIGTAPLIFSLENGWTLWVNFKPRTLYPCERTPVQISKEAGWTPEAVCTFFFLSNRKILPLSGCELQTVQLLVYLLHRLLCCFSGKAVSARSDYPSYEHSETLFASKTMTVSYTARSVGKRYVLPKSCNLRRDSTLRRSAPKL